MIKHNISLYLHFSNISLSPQLTYISLTKSPIYISTSLSSIYLSLPRINSLHFSLDLLFDLLISHSINIYPLSSHIHLIITPSLSSHYLCLHLPTSVNKDIAFTFSTVSYMYMCVRCSVAVLYCSVIHCSSK